MGLGDQDTGLDAAREPRFGVTAIITIVVALAAAAFILLVIVRVGNANAERDQALDRERHSYEVMLAARSIGASMAGAEAALGRYSIGADKAMGSIYYSDWVLAGAQIARLQWLIGRDPVEARLVTRLAALYDQRGGELGTPARHAAKREGWPALNAFNAAGHSPRIAAIDETLDAIHTHELVNLQHRYDQSDRAAATTGSLLSLLSLIGIALIAGAAALGWAVAVAVRRRARAEAKADDAADRAAWLREAVDERTAELSEANTRLEREMGERAIAEAQLHQMQKMEAVGQLTGGIAHDFNNMLAVVVGGLDLARRRLDDGGTGVAQHLDRALDGANRAAALTRRLLGFSRAERLLPEAIEAQALIAGMTDLIDRTLGERVAIETRIAPDCWPIFVDPVQLENAILNLAVNGRDAMSGTGTLRIAAGNASVSAGQVTTLAPGDYLRIAVTDNGTGMTPEVLERAFEPFFTTKPVGKGTGLGLSQIFGFARQSGGDVVIDSALGRGTTVSLYLPRGAAMPAACGKPSAEIVRLVPAATPLVRERCPVLLVEDDSRVRAATAEALAELGYLPLDCADGEAALALLAERADVSVMVTDVVMPGLTGPELAARVRAIRPDLSVLFVTGHAGDSAAELRGEQVLRKPFTLVALERAVEAAFSRVSAPPPAPGVAVAG